MILAQVNDAIKQNMKSKNVFVVSALKSLKAELENNLKDKSPKPEIDVVVAYKNKLVKAQDAYMGKFGMMQQIQKEIDVVAQYLPEQMSEATVLELIKEAVDGLGDNKNMGMVMKAVVPLTKGKFDGKRLSQLVKEALN